MDTKVSTMTIRTIDLDEQEISEIVRAYVAQRFGVLEAKIEGQVSANSYGARCEGRFTHTTHEHTQE